MRRILRFLLPLAALVIPTTSWEASTTANLAINVMVGQAITAVKPGPSIALYNSNPYYTCTNNRYVATIGNKTNNGTSPSTPWDITTASNYAAPGGTCINVAAGTYNLPANGGGTVQIRHGGTSSAVNGYVVWRCSTMPFSFSSGALQGEGTGCVITQAVGNNDYAVIAVNAGVSYVMFDALEVGGTPANQGVCIDDENSGSSSATSHHIWVFNSDMHNCGQSGLQLNYTDWLFLMNNVWHDNSFTNCDMGSGLSIYEPVGLSGYTPASGHNDYWYSNTTGLNYNMVLIYNVGYHNYNGASCAPTTDGEGILLDTFDHSSDACPGVGVCPYNGNVLVMGNIMYYNGGGGLQVFSWSSKLGHATFVNNTAFDNYWDTHNTGTWRGNIFLNNAYNITFMNNIAYAYGTVNGTANQPFVGNGDSGTTGNAWQTNVSYPGGLNNFGTGNTYPTSGTNHNLDGSNPLFVSVTPDSTSNNFSLQSGSPAIGFGQAFDLWQQTGSVEAGACVSSLTTCP